jgi:hypothetical protein
LVYIQRRTDCIQKIDQQKKLSYNTHNRTWPDERLVMSGRKWGDSKTTGMSFLLYNIDSVIQFLIHYYFSLFFFSLSSISLFPISLLYLSLPLSLSLSVPPLITCITKVELCVSVAYIQYSILYPPLYLSLTFPPLSCHSFISSLSLCAPFNSIYDQSWPGAERASV